VDESGANLSFCRLWARAPRGLRAFGSAPQSWGENITILSALSLRGILASMIVPGSTDSDVFLAYVEEVLAPQLWPGAVVLMDNLSPHKSSGVREAIEKPEPGCFTCRPTRLISIPLNTPGASSKLTCAESPLEHTAD